MRFLLDTNVLIWWLAGDRRISAEIVADLEEEANDVLVSAASIWEIEIKRARRNLEAPLDVVATLESQQVALLSISAEHATLAGRLPLHHRDPFDRMIVSQAASEDAIVVTSDSELAQYGVPVRIAG